MALSFKNHRLYADFLWVEQQLKAHQFVCWLAGGAVRDFLMGREVTELDLVTDASTENIKKIFSRVVLVGESFGVIKVQTPSGEIFDLATFREEADYRDGRRPSLVRSSVPTRDTQRRDFTINSLYWDEQGQKLHDHCGGQADLQLRILRAVGEARIRFSEDYLRILRLVRFAAQLDFKIEPQTERAALEQVGKMSEISGERIWAELCKLKTAESWRRLAQMELFSEILRHLFQFKEKAFEIHFSDTALLFLHSAFPNFDATGLIKQKLKVSRREVSLYQMYRRLNGLASQNRQAELVYELEKSELASVAFADLKRSRLLTDEFIFGFEKRWNEREEPYLKAEEMKIFVPVHRLGEELKEARIKQLDGGYKSKAQVVEYLRKKYAT